MADSAVPVTSGSGNNIDTRTEDVNANHRQVVVLGDPVANVGVAPVDGTAGLKVNLGADNDVVASGDVAHDAADSGNPLKVGGQARTTNPAAVADADRVNAIFDKLGKQITVGALRELKGHQQTQISASTTETTIVTAGASGVFRDLYGLILANTGATATTVSIRDATAGTVRAIIEVPAGDTRGFMLPVDSGMSQTTAANNWTAQCDAATTALEVTAFVVNNL